MHALIKSEAYYLMTDPVISRWESRSTVRRRVESVRMKLRLTGRARTNIMDISMRENSAIVKTCGYTFTLTEKFLCANIERLLEVQQDRAALLELLEKQSNNGKKGKHHDKK